MPRITLPSASGGLFDSWDQLTSGMARAYWLGTPPDPDTAMQLSEELAASEMLLHVVLTSEPPASADYPSWVLDQAGELGQAFGATGPLVVLVDPAGRVAALLPAPSSEAIVVRAAELYAASAPVLVQAKAPVLLLERVAEPAFCKTLMDYWQRSSKLANQVASDYGNVVNADIKRRQDVQVSDPLLFVQLRDCVMRRVVPVMEQVYHARINVMEAPLIGCYGSESGGWFRRHKDNTSSATAHRQFALSLNLNSTDEYDGGLLRFPEFGRELYAPVAGGALVFSTAMVHEVTPVTRGRRFGVFTFLSASGPSVIRQPS
ncbi:2OG-Fe(II) oxygenase [Reyranella sp.]|uniref:2OG-Fe(II) oxygenase n=1 Tax=Reyranella sp. TaxID=1929291 RepID=UPI003782D5F4